MGFHTGLDVDIARLPQLNRTACDNTLLASCDQLHGRVIHASIALLGYGLAIGGVWYVCAALRAGAL